MVEEYEAQLDKLEQYTALIKKFKTYMKERPNLFKDVKSHMVFRHMLGGSYGGCIEMTELENLADVEKFVAKLMADKDFQTKIFSKFMKLILPQTYSVNIWTPVP